MTVIDNHFIWVLFRANILDINKRKLKGNITIKEVDSNIIAVRGGASADITWKVVCDRLYANPLLFMGDKLAIIEFIGGHTVQLKKVKEIKTRVIRSSVGVKGIDKEEIEVIPIISINILKSPKRPPKYPEKSAPIILINGPNVKIRLAVALGSPLSRTI